MLITMLEALNRLTVFDYINKCRENDPSKFKAESQTMFVRLNNYNEVEIVLLLNLLH